MYISRNSDECMQLCKHFRSGTAYFHGLKSHPCAFISEPMPGLFLLCVSVPIPPVASRRDLGTKGMCQFYFVRFVLKVLPSTGRALMTLW